jgi:hypothetical protein
MCKVGQGVILTFNKANTQASQFKYFFGCAFYAPLRELCHFGRLGTETWSPVPVLVDYNAKFATSLQVGSPYGAI